MTERRPHLKIGLQKPDRRLEWAGLAVMVILWIFVSITYSKLPDIIPVEYNFEGEVVRQGKRINIFLLPIIASLLFLGISYLNRKPYLMNYPVNITEKNAFRYYTIATRFNRYVKLLIALIFLVIAFRTVQIANGHSGIIGFWSGPIILILFVFPMATLLIYLFKKEKK